MSALQAAAALLVVLALGGCGYTVGDACTSSADCGSQLCLAGPGGYCSLPCGTDGSCPRGSTCVQDAAGVNQPACLRLCQAATECRTSYVCAPSSRSGPLVCQPAAGF